jgi:uncharacterized protein (TIGR02145 family)
MSIKKAVMAAALLLASSAIVAQEIGTLTDKRDGKQYKTVKIGNQTWMAENLNYNAKGSKCYDGKSENCDKYGRLYDWWDARDACPAGWLLPSDEKWAVLEKAVGGSKTAGKSLKATSGWNSGGDGTDAYGFAATPGGIGRADGSFASVGDAGIWWSETMRYYSSEAYRRGIDHNADGTIRNGSNRSLLFSVRCVEATRADIAKQKSLEETILKVVNAYQNKDTAAINSFIFKDFGIGDLYSVHGSITTYGFDIGERISNIPDIGKITNKKIRFESLPDWDCDSEDWSKSPGIYSVRSDLISTVTMYAEITAEQQKELKKIEGDSYVVSALSGQRIVFYLTYLKGKWYLTAINGMTENCGDA